MLPQNEKACYEIAEITALYAKGASGGSQAAGRIIECIVGAAMPLVGSLFEGCNSQDRLLFSLVLTGACTSITQVGDYFESSISITPNTLREAFDVYTRLTGKKIQPHLPKAMLDFAAGGQSHLH